MSSVRVRRNATIDEALAETEQRYAASNPKSSARHLEAVKHLPGGNTRTNMYFSPFPLAIAKGDGARLIDLDGHIYTDMLGEYTAGIYGHSHPRIRSAIIEALDGGLNLGAPNRWVFHLEMLERGYVLSRRGLSALCLPLTDKDIDGFVEAVDDFCSIYRSVLQDDAA